MVVTSMVCPPAGVALLSFGGGLMIGNGAKSAETRWDSGQNAVQVTGGAYWTPPACRRCWLELPEAIPSRASRFPLRHPSKAISGAGLRVVVFDDRCVRGGGPRTT